MPRPSGVLSLSGVGLRDQRFRVSAFMVAIGLSRASLAERRFGEEFIVAIPRLKAPLVLVHGFLGYDRIQVGRFVIREYFRGIDRFLKTAGNRVYVPRLSPTRGIAERAAQLRAYLDQHLPHESVHLIAHSMGGLDARHMVTHLGMASRVLSLTTIGTPHRGSTFATWLLEKLEPWAAPLARWLGIHYEGAKDLTPAACSVFNAVTPDVPRVRYFSVAGHCDGPWLTLRWRLPHALVSRYEGPNDGVVSISSATWGERTDVWDGDHLNLINSPNPSAMRRGLWTDRTAHYARLVQRLADYGF